MRLRYHERRIRYTSLSSTGSPRNSGKCGPPPGKTLRLVDVCQSRQLEKCRTQLIAAARPVPQGTFAEIMVHPRLPCCATACPALGIGWLDQARLSQAARWFERMDCLMIRIPVSELPPIPCGHGSSTPSQHQLSPFLSVDKFVLVCLPFRGLRTHRYPNSEFQIFMALLHHFVDSLVIKPLYLDRLLQCSFAPSRQGLKGSRVRGAAASCTPLETGSVRCPGRNASSLRPEFFFRDSPFIVFGRGLWHGLSCGRKMRGWSFSLRLSSTPPAPE
jgi:hypothetical protein